MRAWFQRLLLVSAIALIAPEGGVVSADTVGGFNFTVPQGWEACKPGDFGFTSYLCNATNAIIAAVRTVYRPDSRYLGRYRSVRRPQA